MKSSQALFALACAFLLGMVATSGMSGCQEQQQTGTPTAKSSSPPADSSTSAAAAGDTAAQTTKEPDQVSAPTESTQTKDTAAVTEPADPAEAATPPVETPEQPTSTAEPQAEAEKSPAKPEQPEAAPPAAEPQQVAKADTKTTAPEEGKPADWPQWGGSPLRNNTPYGRNIPTNWAVGEFDRQTDKWLKETSQNIKWVSSVGSQTYGNAVVADGRVYVGTNNSAGYLKRYPGDIDLGCLLCFRESDGQFLWQHSSEKLPTGRVHDWPFQGICCAPLVEGKRLWFVSSRGLVVCLDTEGYYDGEDDGPVQNELGRLFDLMKSDDAETDQFAPAVAALNAATLTPYLHEQFARTGMTLPEEVAVEVVEPGKKWSFAAKVGSADRQFRVNVAGTKLSAFKIITPDDQDEADTIWQFDMMKTLQVSQHNMCSCSVTSWGDILFVNTSNGVDESHENIPSPEAPSFMAMDKNTGEVLWTDNSPGLNIVHGQWSSPTVGMLGGGAQVLFAGGDGWVYSFAADKGKDGKPELLWKFDANPKESVWKLEGLGTRNNIIATPVIHDGLVYVAVGQDPEHGEGVGHLWCIDPTKRGDVSPQLAMKVVGDKREPIPPRRLQAVIPEQGEVAVDNPNSAVVWHYSAYDQNGDGKISFEEQMHRSCGTVAIKNNLLYIADFSGLFHCLDAKGDGKGNAKVYWTYDMFAQAWGSPLIVENHVYIGDEDGDVAIFDLSAEKHDPISEIYMGSSVYSTPIVANNVLFISTKNRLFAIEAAHEAAE